MNDPIEIAVKRTLSCIPIELLQMGLARERRTQSRIPVEQLIVKTVIEDRVLADCNIHGGRPIKIILQSKWWEPTDGDAAGDQAMYAIYRIPATARENLPLSEVEIVNFSHASLSGSPDGGYGYYGQTSLNSLGHRILDSHTMGGMAHRPTVQVLTGDLIKLTPAQATHIDWELSCRLSYDKAFTNMNSGAIDTFANLVVEATKAKLYNTLVIGISHGVIIDGYSVDAIRDMVDRYSDAEERYREYLDQFAGAVILSSDTLETLLYYAL